MDALVRASQGVHSQSIRPPPQTVLGMPPLPAFPALREFVGKGERCSDSYGTKAAVIGRQQAARGKQRVRGVVVVPIFKPKKIERPCHQFRNSDTCILGDRCKFDHDIRAAAEASIPAGEGRGVKAQMVAWMLVLLAVAGHQAHLL